MESTTVKPHEEYTKVQKPAPATRYGPTFDEIERRDPVQWEMARDAWRTEQKVRQNMLLIYQKRVEECYLRERDNHHQNCREVMNRYMKELKDWRSIKIGSKDGDIERFRQPLIGLYKDVDDVYAAKYGSPGQ